jgi:hypothetical protein
LNFNFYRLKPVRFYFVGGFGQARWLDYSRLVPDCRLTEEGERYLRTHLDALARHTGDSTIKISGVDCLGMDLRISDRLERLMLEDPLPHPEALLQELKARLIKMPSEF